MRMPEVELVAICDLYPERIAASARLFSAKEQYLDYDEMLAQAEVDAVLILSGPGTHAPFTLAAVKAGKHVLLQKPMATTMDDANAIVAAVRQAKVKALIEPSANSLLDADTRYLRDLIDKGVLGNPYWFSLIETGPDHYHPSLGGNPYGRHAFYSADSGGVLFDYPYGPTKIAALLGSCKSVIGMAKISVSERTIVPEGEYDKFLSQVTDPDLANYWDVVLDLPKTERIRMEAEDNAFCVYEMVNGSIGVFHVGRPFHPVLPSSSGRGLQIFGTEGNLIFGEGYLASIISRRRELLPEVSVDGWYHIPYRGDRSRAAWPKPTPGAFNYYHESTQHCMDCIREDRDPLLNVEWGAHITEMMYGAIESSRTGRRYDMTTTVEGQVQIR
jgi:predicted dehydrogenase